MSRLVLGLLVLVVLPASLAAETLESDVAAALSTDEAESRPAVARLRARGVVAFDELLRRRDDGARTERLDALIDAVGGARYCSVSRLFWHTDWDAALAESRRTNKPVLALRMMGNLTDEFSCANSRFFRTTLYANAEISKFLRENYVLHWRSVRPVPRITIDFGDGRRLERTLTGNSIHYVVTPDGTVVDGLPGLYGPRRFASWIGEMKQIVDALAKQPESATTSQLMAGWHGQQAGAITRAWRADLRRIAAEDAAAVAASEGEVAEAPPARDAAVIARPKSMVEIPIIANVVMEGRRLEEETNDDLWDRVAALQLDDAELDAASVALIRSENPTALVAARLAITKDRVEDPLLRMIAKLQQSIAVDTVRNEYQLHRRLHEWFATGDAPSDVEELNEKVYAELFLTPSSDPWIGLVPPDVYTGLVDGGLSTNEGG